MGVSRPTFQRILLSARELIADSLVNGKGIQIEGGNFTQSICELRCLDCGGKWSESCENMSAVRMGSYKCPSCGSTRIVCADNCPGAAAEGFAADTAERTIDLPCNRLVITSSLNSRELL
jgi:hypothetical protein